MALDEFFTWGAGGTKRTPEQIARQRDIANALIGKGVDTSPVGHWMQGLARVANSAAGAYGNWQMDQQEEDGRARGKAAMDPVLEALMGPGGFSSGGGYGAPASPPQTAEASVIREGLIARGLPEHVADGFLMNFQDESGLNPGINEQNPTVPGSRGGYGLYQLTGPRRIAYEQYAQQLGVDPANADTQLDFMMSELQGPEANAYQSIMGTQDAGSAAAAIARDFLRPAPEHLYRRVAQYTGGQSPSRVQVASLDPNIGMPPPVTAASTPGAPSAIDSFSPSLSGSEFAPTLSQNGTSVADALMSSGSRSGAQPAAAASQDIAQLLAPQVQQRNSLLPLLLNASSEPWARQQYGDTIDMLMRSELQMQAQANDPLAALDAEYKRAQIAKMQADVAAGAKPPTSFGTPIWGTDPNGNPAFGTLDSAGNFNVTETPENFSFGKEPIRLDTGTEFTLLDPVTRQVIGTIPKDNYTPALDAAAGGAAGKAGVEAQMGAPEAIATAQRTLSQIQDLKSDPGLWWSTGGMGWTPNVAGNPQAGTISRIEQLQGGAFLQAFESLKGAGQITEVEGTKATNAIARLQRSQGYEDFTQALTELEEIVQAGLERAQRQGQSGAVPQPGGNAGNPGNGGGWEVVGVE